MIDPDLLLRALVEVEESKMNFDCLSDSCDHPDGECPDWGVGCGDYQAIATEYNRLLAEVRT